MWGPRTLNADDDDDRAVLYLYFHISNYYIEVLTGNMIDIIFK